jgi:hypothetical protein
VNIAGFIVSFLLFVGGIWLLGAAFSATGYEALVFFAGIVCSAIGIFIPVHILKRIDA